MNTSYDCRPTSTLSSVFCSVSNAKSNVFWKVFAERELNQLLVQASANGNASIDNLSGSISDHSSQFASDSLSGSESDDESDVLSDLNVDKSNPAHIQDYEKTRQSTIYSSHKSDPGLQTRTARCFLSEDQDASSASFRCPDPDCHDEWPSDTPIYAWYQHLESLKQRPFLDSCGQLACEFV